MLGIIGILVFFKVDLIFECKFYGEVFEFDDFDDVCLVGGKVKIVEVMILVLLFVVDLKGYD